LPNGIGEEDQAAVPFAGPAGISVFLLALLLAGPAPDRKRQRPEPLDGDLGIALETESVFVVVEPDERLVNAEHGLRLHLEQGQSQVSLGGSVRMVDVVAHLFAVSALVADTILEVFLKLAPALAQQVSQALMSYDDLPHGSPPQRGA